MDVYKEWLGIPEGNRPPDHYELLRLVQFEDDFEKIQAHYKKLNAHVRKYASGKYQQESQDLLNEIARAMLCLTDPERKRYYDEEMGRVYEDDLNEMGHLSMGNWLVARGHITKDQLSEAESYAEVRGLELRDALVQTRVTDAELATKAYAEELGHSFVDLEIVLPDETVLDQVPRKTVKKYSILPLFIDDDRILVACIYEPTQLLEDEFRLRFNLPMHPVMAAPLQIQQAIAKYYPPGVREDVGSSVSPEETSSKSGKKKKKPAKSKPAKASSAVFSELSEEEQQQRKQIGIIAICWAIIGGVMLDQYYIKPNLMPEAFNFQWLPSIGTLGLALIVFGWLKTSYWK